MTVSTLANRVTYAGNGVAVTFAFPFKILDSAHLRITLVDNTTLVETLQVITTNYTVPTADIGVEAGGSITMLVAPPTGKTLLIRRLVPLTQPTDFQNQGRFFPETHERALDRGIMATQQQQESIDASIKLAPAVQAATAMAGLNVTVAGRAGKFLAFDTSGDPVVSSGTGADASLRADLASTTAAFGSDLVGLVDPVAPAYLKVVSDIINGESTSVLRFMSRTQQTQLLTGNTDLTARLQEAITAVGDARTTTRPGNLTIPETVNPIIVTSTLTSSPVSSSTLCKGLRLRGAGPFRTRFDNRVANGPMLKITPDVAGRFIFGCDVGGFTILDTTNPANSDGIEIRAVWQSEFSDLYIEGLSRDGIRFTTLVGDAPPPDAGVANRLTNSRITQCLNGFNCNNAASIVQSSYLVLERSYFDQCTGSGVRLIGFAHTIRDCGFTQNDKGLYLPYNGGNNLIITATNSGWENNRLSISIESLGSGRFENCEVAETVGPPTGTPSQGVLMAATGGGEVGDVVFDGTFVRIAGSYNPFTMFTITGGALSPRNSILNTRWTQFDAAGQVRYSDAGTKTRLSDKFEQATIGDSTVAVANGANVDVALSATDEAGIFFLSGPTAVFTISGFTRGFQGRTATFVNDTGHVLTLKGAGTGSAAANQLLLDASADVAINNGGVFTLRYVNTKWRMVGKG